MPVSKTASTKEQSLQSLIVTENLGQEKEILFSGEFKPITSKAELTFDKIKEAVSISESLVQIKEDALHQVNIENSQNAICKYDDQESLQVAQIIMQDNIGKMIHDSPKEDRAVLIHGTHRGLTQIETNSGEKEQLFEKEMNVVKKNAKVTLEEEEAISVSEVLPEESQKPVEEETPPKSATAQIALSSLVPRETIETTASQNLEQFVQHSNDAISITPTTDLLQGLSSTQQVPLETPYELNDHFSISSKIAEKKLDILSEIQVSQVESQTPVKNVEEYKLKEETASHQIEKVRAVCQTEIIANENISEISMDRPFTEQLNVTHDVLQSVTQSFNTPQETENILEIAEKTTKVAVADINENIALRVTEALDYEKEDNLQHFTNDNEKIANVSFPLHNMVIPEKSEIHTHETFENLSKIQPKEEFAQSSQTKLESLIVTENVMHETESNFESISAPQKSPIISLQTGEHVTITEVISSQEETELQDHQTDKKNAEKVIVPQEAMQITEIDVKEGYKLLETNEVSEIYPKCDQNVFHNISITEINTIEKEIDMVGDLNPDYRKADIDLEFPTNPLNIIEVIPQYSETDIHEYAPDYRMATIQINEQSGLQRVETKSYDTIQKFEEKPPTEELGTLVQTQTIGVIVSEQTIQEKETPFDKEELVFNKPNIEISPEECILVSEVFVNQRESQLKDKEILRGEAQKNIIPQKELQITETTAQYTIDTIEPMEMQSSKANTDHVPLTNFTTTEVFTQEKEEDNISRSLPDEHSANINIEYNQGSAVTSEIIYNQSEVPLNYYQPESHMADLNFTELGSFQQSTLVPYDSTNEFQQSSKTEVASISHDKLGSLIVTQTLTQDSESILEIKDTAPKSGQVSILPKEHLITTEVKTNLKEDIFTTTKPDVQSAEQHISTQEAAEVIEVRSEQTLNELIFNRTQERRADSTLIPHQIVSTLEIIPGERNDDYIESTTVSGENAIMNLQPLRSAPITSEVTVEQKEKHLDRFSPEVITADLKLLAETGIQETQPQILDSTRILSDYAPPKESILITQDEQTSVLVSENRIQDTAEVFEVNERLEDTASIKLTPEQHITVTQIISNQKECSIATLPCAGYTAEKVILPFEATEISETKSEEEVKAKFTPSSDMQKAEMKLQPISESLSVFDVITQERETNLSQFHPSQGKAVSSYAENKVITHSKIDILDTVNPICEAQPPRVQATQLPIPTEGIIESEITVGGTTLNLNIQPSIMVEAKMEIIEQQGLTITEVETQSQTADKAFKVSAKQSTSAKQSETLPVVLTEEVTSLMTHDTFGPGSIKTNKAHVSFAEENCGLIVTDHVSADNINEITTENSEFKIKTASISFGERPSSVMVTEVTTQENEGTLVDDIFDTAQAKVTQNIVKTKTAEQHKPFINKDTTYTDETHEIITTFSKGPGESETTSTVTKRTITKNTDCSVIVDEVIDEETAIPHEHKTITIEEIEDESSQPISVTIEMVEDLSNGMIITEVADESDVSVEKSKEDNQEIEEIRQKAENMVTIEVVEFTPEVALPSVIQDLPEETEEIVDYEGNLHKKIIQKKLIKRRKGDKQENTIITSTQVDDDKPIVTVDVVTDRHVGHVETFPSLDSSEIIEELPEEITISEVIDESGSPKKKVTKKRVVKTRKGDKVERTELISVEEVGKKPENTVTIEVVEFTPEVALPAVVLELPDESEELIDNDGNIHKKIIKKKVIKKRKGDKQEKTIILPLR
ncbi:hypothetical protein WA026_021477 [Henosepilachna vigintioctopunctata]|uniref:Titin n=1 Tax=Henosepilachna vigintioctopunctata TaxID=420089 RepID=A0AAW1UFR0_9CUCU